MTMPCVCMLLCGGRQKFVQTVLQLLCVSLATGVLTGLRGGLFTWTMVKLNVRLRQRLFASLLKVR